MQNLGQYAMIMIWTCFSMRKYANAMLKHDQMCWNHKTTY